MHYLRLVRRALLAATLLVMPAAGNAEPLRIATWNVTNYTGGRVGAFQTAIYGVYQGRSLSPDVIIGQEFISAAGVAAFVNLLNTAPGSPGDWAAADFVDGPDTDSALFYRATRVALATDLSPNGVTTVAVGGLSPNHPRNIMRYDLRFAIGTGVEARLALYSTHMKSGSTTDDRNRRLLEAQRIRDNAELLPPGWAFIIGGDTNIQSSGDAAWAELTSSQASDAGRFFDPINTPGTWNNNAGFRFVHTQDPAGAGGMDDRFDVLLTSGGLTDGTGLDYIGNPAIPYSTTTWNDVNHSYRCWGNDGTSYNVALTVAGNTMVGPVIAQALIDSAAGAGHLPVYLELRVPPCLGDFECDSDIDAADFAAFSACWTGPADGPEFTAPSPTCGDYADYESDGDIDLVDLAAFQPAFAP